MCLRLPFRACLLALSFCALSAACADAPLPAGYVKSFLHLGASETDRITGYPTSGQSWLWDFMTYAGFGAEYLQQPKAGQTVDMRLSVNGTASTMLTWTGLTDSNNNGVWDENIGDQYV